MDPHHIPQPDTRDPIQRALERIQLCQFAIQETHYELENPEDTEHRADVLLATEALALEVFDMLETVRRFAWGADHNRPESQDEDY